MGKLIEVWNDFEPYIFQLVLFGVALFALLKDWKDYHEKTGRYRWVALALSIAVFLLGVYETHNTRRETRAKEQVAASEEAENRAQIDTLSRQIELNAMRIERTVMDLGNHSPRCIRSTLNSQLRHRIESY